MTEEDTERPVETCAPDLLAVKLRDCLRKNQSLLDMIRESQDRNDKLRKELAEKTDRNLKYAELIAALAYTRGGTLTVAKTPAAKVEIICCETDTEITAAVQAMSPYCERGVIFEEAKAEGIKRYGGVYQKLADRPITVAGGAAGTVPETLSDAMSAYASNPTPATLSDMHHTVSIIEERVKRLQFENDRLRKLQNELQERQS